MSRTALAGTSLVLGLVAAVGQIAIAFLGFALGGLTTAVILVLIDGVAALGGALLAFRLNLVGIGLYLVAAGGALVGVLTYTLLEVPVTLLLLVGAAAAFLARRVQPD